ncbi:MAG: DUF2459 domain-containing protein [Acidiferrobacteraceae bacterium]
MNILNCVWRPLLDRARRKPPPSALLHTAVAGMMAGLVAGRAPTSPAPGVPLSVDPPISTIGVVDEGWHTGFILPAADVAPSLPEIRQWFPGAKYLIFGWGNRRYYMATHPGWLLGLKALLPSPSVMLIRGLPGNPQRVFLPDVRIRWLCIPRTGIAHIDTYLADYLRAGPKGSLRELRRGPWPNSWFFASTGTYDALHTCNTWTAKACRMAGLPVHSNGVVFAGQVVSEVATLHPCAAPDTAISHPARPK